MALHELNPAHHTLTPVPPTTFAAEHVLERNDLQAALRDNITIISPDLLVVAEEFGNFEAVNRRIDLLAVDTSGHLVVFELKRTDDGGHMELQALRYAAMVSTMTFDQLVTTFEDHLHRTNHPDPSSARTLLTNHLQDAGGEDTVLERHVRIVLISAGFDPQITTTVLWLNDLYQLDISCIRLTPYRVDGRLLLDFQQVIPLPEAAELTVRLRARDSAARAAVSRSAGADWTQYVVITPTGRSDPLRKRHAVMTVVSALAAAGVPVSTLAEVLPPSGFLPVQGVLSGTNLMEAFSDAYPLVDTRPVRWFFDSPVHSGGESWVLTKRWGLRTVPMLERLCTLMPGFSFEPAGD